MISKNFELLFYEKNVGSQKIRFQPRKKYLLCLAFPGFEPAYVWPVKSDETVNGGMNTLRHRNAR